MSLAWGAALRWAVLVSALCLADARPDNTSSPFDVFLISSCAQCTKDGDSIFCSKAGSPTNGVSNGSVTMTIAQKNDLQKNPATADSFCWTGTFGSLLEASVGKLPNPTAGPYPNGFVGGPVMGGGGQFESVASQLSCDQTNLFYRQCVLNNQMSLGLIIGGALAFLLAVTCTCFCCGCCKCCNEKDDKSNWGMFNRFCPWAPCAEPQVKEAEIPQFLVNPLTEKDNASSLFGKSSTTLAKEKAEKEKAEKEKAEKEKGAEKGAGAKSPLSSTGNAGTAVAAGTASAAAGSGGDKTPGGSLFKRPKSGSSKAVAEKDAVVISPGLATLLENSLAVPSVAIDVVVVAGSNL